MIKNGQIEQFAKFSQFETVEDFNHHIALWLQNYQSEFTKSELIGLTQLTRYAVKVVGVANVKIATALKEIHKQYNGNGISRSTWKRMVSKAKKIGLLAAHELKRASGGQSSNLYVFMRYQGSSNIEEKIQKKALVQPTNIHPPAQAEPPCREKMNHQKTNILKTKKIKDEKNRNDEQLKNNSDYETFQLQSSPTEMVLDYTYTSDQVPKPFVNLVKAFYNNCETIEEYWRMAYLAAYHYLYEKDLNFVLHTAIQAFKQTIRKLKKATVKKPIAYFYKVVRNKFAQHFYQIPNDSDHEEGGVYNSQKSLALLFLHDNYKGDY